jgi:soluble lytic murein transglycosylase-like protein
MIIPSILLIGLILTALSAFTGSAYAQFEPNTSRVETHSGPELSRQYPASIQQWEDLILDRAQEYDLDPNFIAAVMLQESGGNAKVISSSGAVGLMQVMPRDGIAATFYCDGKPCFVNRPTMDELKEPAFNIDYGARMLANLIRKNNGSMREALYKYGPMDVGYYYADIVLAIYERYK